MKEKILYIDDEQNNLLSFKAAFRTKYNVLTAFTPVQAVALLMEHDDIKIIFCDQQMPDINGVDLLEQIKSLFPMVVRILITGFADIEDVIDAINRGNIFQYIKKPWNEEEIEEIIKEALEHYNNSSMLVLRNEELSDAYKELDKFAYSVSHDIRGPLSGILTGIDYGLNSDNVDELKSLLEMMKKSLLQLDDYIIAMHKYYNNQKGQISVENIDFNKVVDDIGNIYTVYAEANKVKFEVKVGQKDNFKNDLVSIKLILNNLLSNAFKYQKGESQEKKVSLTVEVKNGIASISIMDNGIGIKEESLNQIFNLHFQTNNVKSGFGLGLYNVKGVLLKLHGQIDVQSELGNGSIFKVSLPDLG